MKRWIGVVMMLLLAAGPALAGKYDLELPAGLGNETFRGVVREAGLVTAYRGVAPAEPQGLSGFDVGLEASFVEVDSAIWDQVLDAGNTSAPSYLPVPRVHVRKGLPFDIDLGVSYAMVPGSNIEQLGAEVQWALLDGGMATPALALRGSYSALLGVDDLDLSTYGLDAVLSKGFLMFTPYVGAGVVQIEGEYAGSDPALTSGPGKLEDVDLSETRYFGGVQMSLGLLRLTLDAELSETPVYTAKLSLGW